jgi:VanZ family protein
MKNKKHLYISLLVIWSVIVCVLLFAPSIAFSHEPKLFNFPGSDKLVHFVLFCVLALLIYKNFLLNGSYNHKTISKSVLIIITLFGLTTEVIQGLTANILKRNFDLLDLVADICGSIVAILIFYFYNKHIEKKKQRNQ